MDDSFGGAKPKIKTPRERNRHLGNRQTTTPDKQINSQPKTTQALKRKESKKCITQDWTIDGQHWTQNDQQFMLNGQQVTTDGLPQQWAQGIMLHEELQFKDDHFSKDICSNKQTPEIKNISADRYLKSDGCIMKEFLPLTEELIKNVVKDTSTNEAVSPSKQLKGSITAHNSNIQQGRTVCNIKKKELTARDRWKKSGIALRNYFSAKFGLSNGISKRENHLKTCFDCVPKPVVQRLHTPKHMEYYSEEEDDKTLENCSQESTASEDYSEGQIGQAVFNSCRQDQVSQDTKAKFSTLMLTKKKEGSNSILKAFRQYKVKKKKSMLNGEDSKTDNTSSTSTCSPAFETDSGSFSSDWPTNSNSANQKTNSANQKTCSSICNCKCDCSSELNSSRKCTCDCSFRSCDQGFRKGNSTYKKCTKDKYKNGKMCAKVDKSNLKVNHQEKTGLIGILDDAIGSSSESEIEHAKVRNGTKRRRRKSGSREVVQTHDIDEGATKRGSLRGFVLTGKPHSELSNSDMTGHTMQHTQKSLRNTKKGQEKGSGVLLGLKYALPYLPERLRSRLNSQQGDKDDVSLDYSTKSPRVEIDNGVDGYSDGHTEADAVIVTDTEGQTRNVNSTCIKKTDGSSYDVSNDCDRNGRRKSRKTFNSVNGAKEQHLNNGDLNEMKIKTINRNEKQNWMPKTNPSLMKFHLNDTGTWTMTKFHENSDSDFEGQCQDHLSENQKLPCDYSKDWLEQDLLQLESSLEDPFNVRGDNLVTNNSQTMGGNSHWTCDNIDLRGDNLITSHSPSITPSRRRDSYSSSDDLGGDNFVTNYSPLIGNETFRTSNHEQKGIYRNYKEGKMSLCSGLMDLVDDIDIPFIDSETEERSFYNSKNIDKLEKECYLRTRTPERAGYEMRETSNRDNVSLSETLNQNMASWNALLDLSETDSLSSCDGIVDSPKSYQSGGIPMYHHEMEKGISASSERDEWMLRNHVSRNSNFRDEDETGSWRPVLPVSESHVESSGPNNKDNGDLPLSLINQSITTDEKPRISAECYSEHRGPVLKGDNSDSDLDLALGASRLPVIEEGSPNMSDLSPALDDRDFHVTGSWHVMFPDSSLDADDEFECDCTHCLDLRQHSMTGTSDFHFDVPSQHRLSPVIDDEEEPTDTLGSDYISGRLLKTLWEKEKLLVTSNFSLSHNVFYLISFNISDVAGGMSDLRSLEMVSTASSLSLGLGVMLENVILQLLTDNVIMQMIAVQPDLLTDQAPPPATQSIIDNIPTIRLSLEDIDQNPVCPVCLCPCVVDEVMSQLPCQHIFHPICVQAWLVKSGTCPVCRYRMTS